LNTPGDYRMVIELLDGEVTQSLLIPEPEQIIEKHFDIPFMSDIPLDAVEMDEPVNKLKVKIGGSGIRGGKLKKRIPFRPIYLKTTDANHHSVSLSPAQLEFTFNPKVKRSPVLPAGHDTVAVFYQPDDDISVSIVLKDQNSNEIPLLNDYHITWDKVKKGTSSSSSGDGGDNKLKKKRRRRRQGKLPHPESTKVHGPALTSPEYNTPSELTLTTCFSNGNPCKYGGELIEVDLISPNGEKIDIG